MAFEAGPGEARQRTLVAWPNRRAKLLSQLITAQPPPSPAQGLEAAARAQRRRACMCEGAEEVVEEEASNNDNGKHGSRHLHGASQFINFLTNVT